MDSFPWALPALLVSLMLSAPAEADTLAFQASDFGLNPIFSDVQTFEFTVDLDLPVAAGTAYTNPPLSGVEYHVYGTLSGTPSGFAAFNLVRSIGGSEFYSQGSSMTFEISAAANLADGLQVSELAGSGTVFEFNGREVDTGRYHPALVRLNSDGTGSIRNSNNFGGVNPSSGEVVDVDFGEEYITELTFDAATLTLIRVFCGADEYVSGHNCIACPAGTTNVAGDVPLREDTACDPIVIYQDGFEVITD